MPLYYYLPLSLSSSLPPSLSLPLSLSLFGLSLLLEDHVLSHQLKILFKKSQTIYENVDLITLCIQKDMRAVYNLRELYNVSEQNNLYNDWR